MNESGTHLIADLWWSTYPGDAVVFATVSAAVAGRFVVLDCARHDFTPHGLTAIWLLSASHASIHTFPERAYAAIDVFTCGDAADPTQALDDLLARLTPDRQVVRVVSRGVHP